MALLDQLYCPFCPFENVDEFLLVQHVETVHPESGEVLSTVKDGSRQEQQAKVFFGQSRSAEDDYLECFCGEFCISSGQSIHLYN